MRKRIVEIPGGWSARVDLEPRSTNQYSDFLIFFVNFFFFGIILSRKISMNINNIIHDECGEYLVLKKYLKFYNINSFELFVHR